MSAAIPAASPEPETEIDGIEPTRLVLRPLLNLDEDQFFQLCVQNPEQPLEQNAQGDVIFVAPHGLLLSSQNAKIAYQLTSWDHEEKHGITFGSRTPFRFPDNSVRRPDAAWVERSRWDCLTREEQESIARLCPNFVIELRSESDRVVDLKQSLSSIWPTAWNSAGSSTRCNVEYTSTPPGNRSKSLTGLKQLPALDAWLGLCWS